MRFGEIRYFHIHLYVKLDEGEPPKNYRELGSPHFWKKNTEDRLNEYVEKKLRNRKIDYGL